MIAPNEVTVKMAEGQQVRVSGSGVEIQDARAYSPRTVAGMSLEDAVAVAKAILSFAGGDADAPTEAEMEAIRRYEEGRDAKADAISAHWGWD